MAKDILIYADGTGQAGGVRPDQRLSNIYKMYRATRTGPDSPIDPGKQVAFYDAGLGTDDDSGASPLAVWRFMRKLLSSITGTGINRNITDCYEAILKAYESGDRIYLFGFSRGAYTVRCVANVLSLCGMPMHDCDGKPLKRFGRRLRELATEAVKSVYEHSAGGFRDGAILEETQEKARRFRVTYGSDADGQSNVVPYFIGVFDTVAALGIPVAMRYVIGVVSVMALSLSYWMIADFLHSPALARWVLYVSILVILVMVGWYFLGRIRVIKDFPAPGISKWHFASGGSRSYDLRLDPRVEYARHALAIDERRKDFARVGWGKRGVVSPRKPGQGEWLIQLWFAGCHSDIGGSYAEDESRLSDISLKWMIDELLGVEHPIQIEKNKLHMYPSAAGVQHCEIETMLDRYPSWWPRWLRFAWSAKPRIEARGAPKHESVKQRFECKSVSNCGVAKPYRPTALEDDEAFALYYGLSSESQ